MNIRNTRMGRIRLVVATALTLVFSVAQSAETGRSFYGLDGIRSVDSGFNQEYSRGFTDIDELGFLGDSNARVVLSRADELGEMSVIEMHTNDSTRTHFNFRPNATDEVLSATLVISGADYTLTYDLPAGQILLENDRISVITASDFSQAILTGGQISDLDNGHFASLLNDVLQDSDLSGFNLSMAESLAESDLLSLSLIQEQSVKGDEQYAEGGWGCGGALLALAAANAALAAAIAATYATAGVAAAAIAAAVSMVGIAMVAVDQYCMQM